MRIFDRQMREIMLKQEARSNGHTYAVHRMNADTPLTRNTEAIADEYDFSTPLQTSRQHDAVVDTRLQELTTATKERVNEVSQAMASNLREMGGTIFQRMLGNRQSAPSATRRTIPDNLPVLEYEGSPISGGDDAQVEYQATGASSSTAQQPPPLPLYPVFKTTIDNNISPAYWKNNPNLTVDDIKFQFYLRGIQVPKESEIQEELKHKGRGKARTYKEYLTDMILDTIDNGGWIVNLGKGRIEELKASFKGKGKK